MNASENEQKTGRGVSRPKRSGKQIAALIAVALLVLLYLATLLAALFDASASGILFRASLVGTFTIPLITWVYIWMYGKLRNRHTMADLDLGGRPEPGDPSGDESATDTADSAKATDDSDNGDHFAP